MYVSQKIDQERGLRWQMPCLWMMRLAANAAVAAAKSGLFVNLKALARVARRRFGQQFGRRRIPQVCRSAMGALACSADGGNEMAEQQQFGGGKYG